MIPHPKPAKRHRRRRNDSEWREQVILFRGRRCRSCGETRDLQADHVVERSQGGKSVVENGMLLCGPFSQVSPHRGGCHAAVTEGRMLRRYEWLDPDQVEWLAEGGWVWWDDDGLPAGRLCRGFEKRVVT